ncbi:MAG: N-acetylmuramoyl-L-alanine amidase, partial [Eubacteriales bacterium]|nr:N-acetylmuramoyl-L-alanine amidase [Eubacteriales bacterium]
MVKIAIDAGHGGSDPGAVFEGRQEKKDNLKLALSVGEALEKAGAQVIYTRKEDIYQTPLQKAKLANEEKADWLISFHRNSGPVANQYTGVETLVYDDRGEKAELARNINESLERIGFKNNGVKERPGLIVLRRSEMPSVLIETGFINSEEDNVLFDEEYDRIVQAITGAILEAAKVQSPEATSDSGSQTTKGENTSGTELVYYRVQVGAYKHRENAQRQLEQLQRAGYPAFLT